jgi:DNA-3-methyladenine glycosylase II
MPRIIETDADLAEGLAHLASRHPRFGEIAQRLGPPALRRAPPGIAGLLRIITDQMISLQAGAAIWRRIEAEIAPFEPKTIMRKREATWLRLGLSRAKARSFKALAQAVDSGAVPLARFGEMSDAEIFTALTAVPGIGRWTVEIYLLSHLGRSDVWPAGDLALQIAAHDAFGLEARPDEAAMRALAAPWQPWRAVAARLLWAHYRSLRNMPQASD